MKVILSLSLFLTSVFAVFAQAPQKFSFQSIIRDAGGQIHSNQPVTMRLSILQGTDNGTAVFIETHSGNTNNNGLLSLQIGGGTLVSGSLSGIDWASGPYFIKTETDPDGGSNYSISGTSPLLSVPYSLHSNTSSSASNGVPTGGSHGQVLTLCNGVLTWTIGGNCPTGQVGTISQLNCTSATNQGVLLSAQAATGVSSGIPYTGGNGGNFNALSINSTGVTGLTATLAAGSFANGAGTLTWNISGIPSGSGTASFAISAGGQSCTFTRDVTSGGGSSGSSHTCGATNVHNSSQTYGNMTDQDGNVYKTITIGTQTWMAENLRTSHFRNGNLIPIITSNTGWNSSTGAAACWFNNDSANYNCPYGKLYNWYAVSDIRNICPVGWHMPSDIEWYNLENYLDATINNPSTLTGRGSTIGIKIKSVGTQYWQSPNLGTTNSSGSSLIAGGYRTSGSSNLLTYGYYWTSTQSTITTGQGMYRRLEYNTNQSYRADHSYSYGMSVRCMKD